MFKKVAILIFSLVFTRLSAQHLADTLLHPRNVLIENFTGVKCGNSPPAMDTLDNIKQQYPSRVSLLNIHAGFYANPNGTYPDDFRTTFGTSEDNYFGMSAAGTPDGLINREFFNSNQIVQSSGYKADVNSIFSSGNSPVNIGAVATYNNNSTVISVNTELYFMSTVNGALINVVLAEDSIYSTQCNYSVPNSCPSLYYNNHVLRYCLSGQWDGNYLIPAITQQHTYFQNTFNYTVPSTININHSYVIVYVSDSTSNRIIYTVQSLPVNLSSGIENKTNQSLVLFPNPTTGILSITTNAVIKEIKITDIMGKEVVSYKLEVISGKNKVDLNNFESGIYFITLKTTEGYITRKIIKQ